MSVGLFGREIIERPRFTASGKKKRDETPKGYAAHPGTGPANETCKTCVSAVCKEGYSKNHWKCWRLQSVWTNSYGTDIRLKSPACMFWAPKPSNAHEKG